MKHLHYSNFDVAGFSYYDGAIVFNELKIGTRLRFVREKQNTHDEDAVAIYYGENQIGYVPRSNNTQIAKFLDLGYEEIFDVRINRISPDAYPEAQIGVIVYIRRRE